MAIVASDLLFKLTVTTGSAGNSTAGTPNTSLGKYVSTTQLSGTTLNNLFDDVSGTENAASTVDYRAIAVHNNNATLTLSNGVVYLSAEVAGGASIAIATDNIGNVAVGSATAQGAQIANELTAPTGTSAFSSPTTAAAGLSIGNLGPGQVRVIWVRRTAANTSAVDADGVTFAVSGDSPA